jgi:EthD domain-containing protein
MDKVVFFFRRKDGLSRDEFHDHYLHQHAPLGLRVTQTMDGYTVNLVDSSSDVDAVTEVWTASMDDFFDPVTSFATEADAKTLMADHDSFIGPYDAYAVEEQVVQGALPVAALGDVASATKVFVRYADAADIPPPPADALHVVDQRVVANVMPGSPDVAVVRALWFAGGSAPDVLGPDGLGTDALVVREVRMKPPT